MNSDKQVTVSTRWDNELVPAGKCSERNLLIEVEAPPKPESLAPRPPINLALVIDRSGSMGGERIDAARLAASGIAEALSDKDRLSLVVFDEEVEALLDGCTMDERGKTQAKALINRIYPRGTTDLAAGWFTGSQCAAKWAECSGLAEGHVLVLSDGHANRGVCDAEQLRHHTGELAERGIKTSAVGIGANYSLLQLDALAEGGRGRLHDAETTEDIIDVVLGELGELHAITAQDARLNLLYPPTVQLDFLTRNSFDGDASTYTVRLGDIAADAVRSVAVRVEVPALAEGEKLPFSITLGWKGPGEERHPRIIEHGTSLYIVPPHEAEARGTDLSVVERVADLWEAALAYRTMRYNEQGHFRKASAIYELHDAAFADLVNELPDVSERVGRYHATQRRVSRRWQRRSKRQAYIRSKKAMLAERDLRRGDAGEWHDHLSD